MENKTKYALFRGGVANGQTKEISEAELRLHVFGNIYLHQGEEETELYGLVQIYTPERKKEPPRKSLLKHP